MRVVKACLGALLASALIVMWTTRDVVIAAYANEGRSSTEVQLGGVDLTVELTPIEPSPFEVIAAPDTRREAIAQTFADEVAVAVEPEDPAGSEPATDGDQPAEGEVAAVVTTTQPPTTVEPPPIYGGTAQLTGLVTGPDGGVPFAAVRLERHTREGTVAKDLVTDRNGRWNAARLVGGRYRVWAWSSQDDLAMPASEVFFLDDGAVRRTDLPLEEIDPEPRVTLTDRGDIYVGLSGTVAISITAQTVDPDGRVVISGLPGTLVAFDASSGVVTSPAFALTDDDGVARFTVDCLTEGRPIVHVRHSADVRIDPDDPEPIHGFALPACVPIPPPTTTTIPPAATPATTPTTTPTGQPTATRPAGTDGQATGG